MLQSHALHFQFESLAHIASDTSLGRWAWYSRGLTTAANLCQWHGVTTADFARDNKRAVTNEAFDLTEVPVNEKQEPSAIAAKPMRGESVFQWQIATTALPVEEEGPTAEERDTLLYNLLPTFMVPVVERELALFEKTLQELRKKVLEDEARAKNSYCESQCV